MASAVEESAEESISKEEVMQWLQSVLGGEEQIELELDNEKLKILHALMEDNKEMCRVTNLVIDDMNRKAAEYAAEGKRIASMLSKVGVSLHSLPELHQSVLAAMCSASGLLNLKNPSMSNFLLGISDLSEELSKVQLERLNEQKLLQKLVLKSKYMEGKLNHYKKELGTAEECIEKQSDKARKLEEDMKFLLSKENEYKEQIKAIMSELEILGVTEDIHHDQLVSKAKEVDALNQQLKVTKAKLEEFHNLPPDIELAQAVLMKKKEENDALYQKLTDA